eukprot:RCo038618
MILRGVFRFSFRVRPRFASTSPPGRSSAYAEVSNTDMEFFQSVLPKGVVTESSRLELYNTDWLHNWRGRSKIALCPTTTEQVSAILKYCNERRLAVCPQGGNTGLVGGSIPAHDEIVLSLEKMSRILDFDTVSGTVTCEAGCILEAVDNFLAEKGHMMPLDLGAKGSCQIGGNVSTNAGGLRFLRYGSLHHNVLGLKAVLANGTVVDQMNTCKKDNTGYDLKQLFIGSEGSLGVVTEVVLQTPPRPAATNVALLACPSYQAVQGTFVLARRHLAEILSAYEFADEEAMNRVLTVFPHNKYPLDSRYPFYVLVETQGSNAAMTRRSYSSSSRLGCRRGASWTAPSRSPVPRRRPCGGFARKSRWRWPGWATTTSTMSASRCPGCMSL